MLRFLCTRLNWCEYEEIWSTNEINSNKSYKESKQLEYNIIIYIYSQIQEFKLSSKTRSRRGGYPQK